MGKSILNTVIDLLVEGGIPAAPAQPEGHMLTIHSPVAAVSIAQADMESATVLVQMVAPIQNGAERCQKRALKVYELLRNAGAECLQGKCTFEGKSALFCVPVTAKFYGTAAADDWTPRPAFNVVFAGATLTHTQSFSAQQVKEEPEESEEGGTVVETTLSSAPWSFTLEEMFPIGTQEPTDPQEPFALRITGTGKTEIFNNCTLTERLRVHTASGIRQVRKGVAASRKVQ